MEPKITHYVTVFNAKTTQLKKAWSPYDDNTFIFQTYEINEYDNQKLFNVLVSNWTLNVPLEHLKEPVRTFRRKTHLDPFYGETLTYFVLDIDKVTSKESQDKILEYFSKYKCILGESKSHDGVENFNMKGILFIEPILIENAKQAISNLHFDLMDCCEIDEAVCRKASLNAPIGKNKILLDRDRILYECKFDKQVVALTEHKDVKSTVDFNNIAGDTIEDYCLNVFNSMGFEAMQMNANGSLQFKHPSELKSIGGYYWFSKSPYSMFHNNSTKTINIFEHVRNSEKGKELLKTELDYNDKFLHFNTATKVITCHEQYLTVKGKEDSILEFLENKEGLYCIKSPMGTGKSTIIQHIIQEAHSLDMRVLIITNRISVAVDFAGKYNLKIYNKDQYELNDSMIVQFDSLWRYDINKFDVVIMDEFISLMSHSRNNLGNSSLNIAKFFGAFAKKLVIADAFLTGYENFLLDHKKSNVFQLNNTWRDKTTLFSYKDKNYFIQSLLVHAKKGKITISGTSLQFLHSTKALLEKHGFKVILLTAGTPESTKELIYDLFTKETHDKWDIFMYSPSLTVGVSNLNDVQYHFHYDSSMSTDVISSIQMIKRSRKAREIHMFIQERVNYVKTDYNTVRDEYLNNIGKNIDQNFLFDVDKYGTSKLSNIGKNAIKIDTFKNILEFNHKKAMEWMLKYHFFGEPRIVDHRFQGNILARYSREFKENEHTKQEQNIKDFLVLNDVEKMNIAMGVDDTADNFMRALVDTYSNIKKDTPHHVKERILGICVKDKQFIAKCKNYKVLIDYTSSFISDRDIKELISEAMVKNTDIKFLTRLLRYGQNFIKQYYQGTPEENLLYLLKEAGFKRLTREDLITKDIGLMAESEKHEFLEKAQKVWRVESDVKELYGYVKNLNKITI